MNTDILQKYQALASQYQLLSDSKKKQLKLISFARLICFVSIIPAYYYLSLVNSLLAFVASFLCLAVFLFLIKKFIQTEKQQLFYQRLGEINHHEAGALNRNLSPFDPGTEFTDPHHDYSYDLDLYGTGSIFQFLNRTVTNRGKKHLSSLLNQTQRPAEEIRQKQEAIQELADELTWRQNFMAKGMKTEDQKTQTQIDESVRQIIILKSVKLLKYLLIILPPITLLLIGLNMAGIISNSFYFIAVFSQWVIFLIYSKTISRFQKQFESQAKLISRYSEMLHQIETIGFKSNYLVELKGKLSHEGKTAS